MSRTEQWADIRVGDVVRCTCPDDFVTALAAKLRNRDGVVARFQHGSGAPIVEFARAGRRKPHMWVPPNRRDVIVVSEGSE